MNTTVTHLDFSIVIPVLNEEKYLPQLLSDLSKQTFRTEHFEVLVIDGNSQDKSVTLAKKFDNVLQLSIIQATKPNVSFQRNLGAKQAKADWVIFMDADNRIPPSFLDGIKYQLAKNKKTKCFTCWIDDTDYKTADKPLVTMINLSLEVFAKVRPGAPGALIGVRRALACKFPFDQTLALSEDHEFIGKLVKTNHHFSVLRYPRYRYRLRRLESEGTLKLARTYAKAQLYLLLGRKIKNGDVDYPMGGDIHKIKTAWHKTTVKLMRTNFTDLVKNHQKTAKKILDWLLADQN